MCPSLQLSERFSRKLIKKQTFGHTLQRQIF